MHNKDNSDYYYYYYNKTKIDKITREITLHSVFNRKYRLSIIAASDVCQLGIEWLIVSEVMTHLNIGRFRLITRTPTHSVVKCLPASSLSVIGCLSTSIQLPYLVKPVCCRCLATCPVILPDLEVGKRRKLVAAFKSKNNYLHNDFVGKSWISTC